MKSSTKFVGLDVSKATIAVAVIGPADPAPRYLVPSRTPPSRSVNLCIAWGSRKSW
jgi:hypothetical protein